MTSPVTIQTLSPDDRDAFTQMVHSYLTEILPNMDQPSQDQIAQSWRKDDRDAFTFHAADLIGFAVVRHLPASAREMSEFYIAPRHRRAGTGLHIARNIIARFPGRWQLGLVSGSTAARAFWQRVLEHHSVKRGPPLTPNQSGSLHFIERETLT